MSLANLQVSTSPGLSPCNVNRTLYYDTDAMSAKFIKLVFNAYYELYNNNHSFILPIFTLFTICNYFSYDLWFSATTNFLMIRTRRYHLTYNIHARKFKSIDWVAALSLRFPAGSQHTQLLTNNSQLIKLRTELTDTSTTLYRGDESPLLPEKPITTFLKYCGVIDT